MNERWSDAAKIAHGEDAKIGTSWSLKGNKTSFT